MGSKLWLVFGVLALALIVAIESSTLDESHWGILNSADGGLPAMRSCNGRIGDCIGDDEEGFLDSESGRRQLAARRRYISYDALRKNNVPCSRRGQSYYYCRKNQQANPYKRGCTYITRCARYLG